MALSPSVPIAVVGVLTGAPVTSTVTVSRPVEPAAVTEDVENIVVTGSRREVAVSDSIVGVDVLSREDIEASGAEDVAELLEGQPGLQIDRSFSGAGIRIQGFDPVHTLILIDGQRVNGRINGTIDLQRIAAERIERVEIVKGAASALYGSDALAGVVNIITRAGREPFSASVHAAYGSLSPSSEPFSSNQTNTVDTSARISGRGKNWDVSLTGGFHRRDAFDLTPEDAATSGSELMSFNIEARGTYRFSETFSLTGRVDFFERQLNGIELGPELPDIPDVPGAPRPGRAIFDRRNRPRSYSASLQSKVELAREHDLEIITHFTRFEDLFERDQRQQTIQDTRQETTDNLGQLTLQYVGGLSDAHVLTAGTELLYERLATERLRGGRSDRGRVSVFVQDEWRPFNSLAFVPGFRLDIDTQFGTFPTPKLAVRYDLNSSIVLRGSYGFGFRAPGFRDLFIVFENPGAGYRVNGNDDLNPETSRNLTVGAELSLFQGTVARVEFYRNDISNLIAFLPDADVVPGELQTFTNGNIGSATTQGIETSLDIRWHRILRTDASYTYLDAQNLDEDRFLQGRARHRVTFRVRAESRDIGLSAWIRGTYVDSRPFYIPDEQDSSITVREIADAYTSVDARIAQNVGEHFTVFVGADNILNAGDPRFLAIPPFGIYGGLDARL